MIKIRTGLAVAAFAAIVGGPAVAAIPASAATPTAGVTTTVVLDNGGYKQCLNDKGGSHANGTPAVLYACSSSTNNQWVTYPDNTLRPAGDVALALTDVSGKAVLEPAGQSGQDVYLRADGSIVSGVSQPGDSRILLNDPGFNAANGTAVIFYGETGAASTNEHWYVPKARYATSTLSARPDSGNGGANWANDHITRASMVLYMGDETSGQHSYQGSIADTGSAYGVAGNQDPNQSGSFAGQTQADSTTSTMVGFGNYLFTSTAFVSSAPASAYSGGSPSTGNWPELYFASGAVTDAGLQGSGPVAWHFGYQLAAKDSCGVQEAWVDAADNSGGAGTTAGEIFGGPGTAASNSPCSVITATARPDIYGDGTS